MSHCIYIIIALLIFHYNFQLQKRNLLICLLMQRELFVYRRCLLALHRCFAVSGWRSVRVWASVADEKICAYFSTSVLMRYSMECNEIICISLYEYVWVLCGNSGMRKRLWLWRWQCNETKVWTRHEFKQLRFWHVEMDFRFGL